MKGGNCKEYTDKGYSGKNTDRPKFQELVRDIKRGLIAKVVVYKLDRISRSILDFANMMELFQQYNVEFVSSTEKFDTSTPMGRAMLNICIVFAQLERETIQKRVTDAYYSRSQRGFKMGGKAPYGFHTEPIKMDGINTKKLVVNPDEAANIRLMFEEKTQMEDIPEHAGKTFIDLFKEMAARYPDRPAVRDDSGDFTYRELDRMSDYIAQKLTENGFGPEQAAGCLLYTSPSPRDTR
mgnify:CR=1 FL=1